MYKTRTSQHIFASLLSFLLQMFSIITTWSPYITQRLLDQHHTTYVTICLTTAPSHSSDWPHFLQVSHKSNTFLSSQPLQHPCKPDSAILKMYAAHSPKTSESTSNTEHRKPKEHHKLIKYVVFNGYIMIPGRTLIIIKQMKIKPLAHTCTCVSPLPTSPHTQFNVYTRNR